MLILFVSKKRSLRGDDDSVKCVGSEIILERLYITYKWKLSKKRIDEIHPFSNVFTGGGQLPKHYPRPLTQYLF